jgi:acyl-CoA thioester hydrolase
MNVDYVDQIYFGKNVENKTCMKRIVNSSLELYEEIPRKLIRLCAKGTANYVNFNLQTQKP